MKKITQSSLLMLLMCILAFSSCDKDDKKGEPGKPDEPEKPTISYVNTTFSVEFERNLTDLLTYKIEYYGPDGVKKIDQVTGNKWTREFKNCKLTDTVGFKIIYEKNDKSAEAGKEYDITIKPSYKYETFSSNNESLGGASFSFANLYYEKIQAKDVAGIIGFLNELDGYKYRFAK